MRAAIAVVIVLLVWIWLDLPSFQQMAITVAVVMAAPGAPAASGWTPGMPSPSGRCIASSAA